MASGPVQGCVRSAERAWAWGAARLSGAAALFDDDSGWRRALAARASGLERRARAWTHRRVWLVPPAKPTLGQQLGALRLTLGRIQRVRRERAERAERRARDPLLRWQQSKAMVEVAVHWKNQLPDDESDDAPDVKPEPAPEEPLGFIKADMKVV